MLCRVLCCLFVMLGIVMTGNPFWAQGSTKTPPADQEKKTWVARSHEELGQLASKAIDRENYEAINKLMVPKEVSASLGAPKSSQEKYAKYLKRIPTQAKRYRKFLNDLGLLPLGQWQIYKLREPLPVDLKILNGKTIRTTSGVRLVDENAKVKVELIDRAISIDGRWYIAKLCTEGTERELKKSDGK